MREKMLFKVKFLGNKYYFFGNSPGDIVPVYEEDDRYYYYYDDFHRWCYIEKECAEKIEPKRKKK